MKRPTASFNIFFLTLACFSLWTGCASSDSDKTPKHSKKEQSTIRLYMEGLRADAMSSGTVLVTHERFPFTIQRDPFLTEADLSKASLVSNPDGTYDISLLFNDHGTLLLEMFTSDHPGKHVIVFSQFPIPGHKAKKERAKRGNADDDDITPASSEAEATSKGPRESAWLAAVLVRNRIANGLFTFTPDCSREEAERIVRGLKNVIAKAKKNDKF